ncbi:hypothetical protein EIP91_000011 [Steccherinum ochraceum]|uniref:DUF4211 domain-containing protein n=1 Tax=Steccherinum ochraceum TaxID=92696 RepID=A0A4R0RZG2_9APHY|nr:hypothetical protein EIP91_000011 [Steccherinum ochraceum]
MPRKTKLGATQKTLDGFLSGNSSPPQPSSSNRPIRPRSGVAATQMTSQKSRKTRATHFSDEDAQTPESGSDVGAISFEPKVIELTDSEEEAKSSPQRKPATTRHIRKRRAKSDDEADSSPLDSPDEGNSIMPIVWKGKGKAGQEKRKVVVEDSDAEDAEEDVQPKRRKIVRGQRPPTPEPDDLMEELDEHRILDTRLRTRDKKSAFLKNLERMKRRKRGEKVSESEEEDEASDEAPAKPFKRARPGLVSPEDDSESGSENANEEEEEEDTFIVEDDNAVPLELPAQFSMSTYQDLTHHFKVICQLFVHLAVQKREDRADFMEQMRKDQYFSVPLQIARRKIDGTKDAIVASSVWRTEYKNPLLTYPVFEIDQLQFSVPACDACRLGGRISTLCGRLSGQPYDKQTFEPLSESDLEDSDGYDSEDDKPKKSKKQFHLGRFCARRTRVFHEFTHWEYSLFHALAREVDDLRDRNTKKKPGGRIFVPVAYVGAVKPPEDISDADAVMAWLDSRQIIAREVAKLKHMMESANNLEVASKRGEEDE